MDKNTTKAEEIMSEITKEQVQEMLRKGECSFIFMKANGEEREANGTLHPDYLPIQDEDAPKGNSNETDETVTYWDLDACNWRRFRLDSLLSFPIVVEER